MTHPTESTADIPAAATAGPAHPAAAATEDPQYARRWWILALLSTAQLMVVLDATIVNIALPHAQTALGFSNSDRQWIVTGYSLAFGSLLLLGGRIADLFGRKQALIVGVIGFAAASAFGGAAQNFDMLLIARVVQGAFGALLAPAALSLVTTTFTSPAERTKAMGIFGGIAGGGASVGLLLGGVLTEYLNWRYVMYVNVLIAAIALTGSLILLTAVHVADRPKLDLVGTVLGAVGMFAIVFGFSNASMSAGSTGWTKPLTLVALIGGAALLVTFVLVEQRVAHPLLPLRIVTDRNRAGAYLAMFLAAVGLFGVFLFLTYYLEVNLQWSAVKTGLAFLPLTLILVVVAAAGNGVLLTRVSPRLLMPSGLLIAAVGMGLLTRIGLISDYGSDVLPSLLLIGGGLGLVFAPAFTLGTLGVDAQDAGVASATVNVAQQIGGSIGTSLLNTIAAVAASGYLTAHAASITSAASKQLVVANSLVSSYHTVFWVAGGIYVGAAAVCGLLLRSGIAIPPDASPEPLVHAG